MAARSLPHSVGGVTYPSLRAASRATGTPLSTLRRSLGLIGPEQPANRPAYRAVRRQQAAVQRAVKSGRASPLPARRQFTERDRRQLRYEMPPRKGGGKVSLTHEALAQISGRISRGDIVQASLTFYHYYLSPTEKDKNGNPKVRIRRSVVIMPLDLLRAVPLIERERRRLYPFDNPETQLHENRPRLPNGRPDPKHKDDGGLVAVTLTPRLHTSL